MHLILTTASSRIGKYEAPSVEKLHKGGISCQGIWLYCNNPVITDFLDKNFQLLKLTKLAPTGYLTVF